MPLFLATYNSKKLSNIEIKKTLKYKNRNYPRTIKWNDNYFAIKILFKENIKEQFFLNKGSCFVFFNGLVLSDKNKKPLSARQISQLYKIKGTNFIKKLNGFYSIILFDFKTKKLISIRDHAGVKNIYYTLSNESISISNYLSILYESKIIRFIPNYEAYLEHIIHGNIVGGETISKNVYQLPAANFLKYNYSKLKLLEFWKKKKIRSNISLRKKIQKFDKLFKEVIKDWVPKKKNLSLLLSGGLDSSLLSKLIMKRNSKLRFYTAIFEKKYGYNETNLITKTSSQINKRHNFFKIKENKFSNHLINYIRRTHHPITNYNGLVIDHLSKKIKKEKNCKIIYTGEGSDELFSGFYRHFEISQKFKKTKNIKDLIMSKNYLNVRRLRYIKKNFKYNIPLTRIDIAKSIKDNIAIKKYLILDQKTYMSAYLDRLDQCSYLNNMEIRPVFMDKRIMEFSQTLNENDYSNLSLDNKLNTKIFLRKYSEKYLEKDISYPKNKKMQLMIPSSNWFYQGKLKKMLLSSLSKKSFFFKEFGLKKVSNLIKEHSPERQSKKDHSSFFERILAYEIWLKFMYKYKK